MNRFASWFDHVGMLPVVLLFLSAGCGGATCPPGSESMAGRCVSLDASLDAGPDAQADAGDDASVDVGDASVPDSGTDGSMPDGGIDDSAVPDAGPSCAGGLDVCDGSCTDTQVDPLNCGACGVSCGASETCCAGSCVDTSSDASSCGACGVMCGASETCCGGSCVDTSSDVSACGACGVSCGASETCCAGSCVDTSSDVSACGACGVVCGASEACCAGGCVNLDSDEAHCGVCATSCTASETCCTGACSDLSSDAAHCGSCGTSCGSSEACTSTDPRAAGAVCECNVGTACTSNADCFGGRICIPELNLSSNPDDLRGGGVTDALFSGGYCSSGRPGPGVSVCDPAADDCGACSSCLSVNKTGAPIYACLQDCSVNVFDNGGCRPGYQCDPVTAACIEGCTTNAQCNRVRLADGSVTTIVDGTGVCNTATSRCEHMQAPGSHTGDACPDDFSCPTNQQCVFAIDGASSSVSWPGGYCSRTACEVTGFSCPGDAVCTGRSPGLTLDQPRCLHPCTFMGESGNATLRVGVNGHGVECRAGYSCSWDGTSIVGTPSSGSCQPGNYNAVASANYGASCTNDSQCYSPYGLGRCFGEPGAPHFCTLLDCTIQETVGTACGSNVCAPISSDGRIEGCVKSCTSATDCNANQGCVVGGGSRICVNYCHSGLDCRSGQTCSIPAGETAGTCI